jgi:hypothetical protein
MLVVSRLGAALVVLVLTTPTWAQEVCRQSDISAAWDLYIAGGEVDGPWAGWDACRVTISRQGVPRGPCLGDEGAVTEIVGGQLNVRENCRISGRLVLENARGARVTLSLPRATLSFSGEVMAGIGRFRLDGSLVSALFQMIRR